LADVQELSGLGSQLVQTALAFENYFTQELGESQLDIHLEGSREETNYDLWLVAYRTSQLGLKAMYKHGKYGEIEIQSILERLKTLLQVILENPDVKLSETSMITEVERDLILGEFNDTFTEYPRDKTVVQLFEEQVERTPEHIAVVYEEEQLTYQELNAKANALAHQLRELGVRPDDYVAIMTERSLEMIIGIYGIIKSGGAYVPIDPTYPEDRIQYVLEDCQPKAVLTYQAKIETPIPVLDLGDTSVWEDATENPEAVNTPKDLVYLIYTSGTTGRPKGVMVEHGNLCNYVMYAQSSYATKMPVIPLFTNYTFDLTVTSIFLPLISGGKMLIYSGEADEDIEKIFAHPEITLVKLTPSHLKMTLLMENDLPMNQLETLVLGGEELGTQLSHQAVTRYGKQMKIHNEYGRATRFSISA
jgi:non-ribosomal peptide synthetase component F